MSFECLVGSQGTGGPPTRAWQARGHARESGPPGAVQI